MPGSGSSRAQRLHAALHCALRAARCTLHAARCASHAARCLPLRASRRVVCIARCALRAARCAPCAACWALRAALRMLRVAWRTRPGPRSQ
eukprot:8202964-Lingulodinium_polyedra.AAC.1